MPPDLVLLSTLIGSNYPCLELNFMVPKVLEPLKFKCTIVGNQVAAHSFAKSLPLSYFTEFHLLVIIGIALLMNQ